MPLNISEIILKYLLDGIKKEDEIQFQRNKLAKNFNCSPSHINYVIKKEFENNNAYVIQIQKGVGGYIKIRKIKWESVPPLQWDLENCIDFLSKLYHHEHITKKEYLCMKIAIKEIHSEQARKEIVSDWLKIIKGEYI